MSYLISQSNLFFRTKLPEEQLDYSAIHVLQINLQSDHSAIHCAEFLGFYHITSPYVQKCIC